MKSGEVWRVDADPTRGTSVSEQTTAKSSKLILGLPLGSAWGLVRSRSIVHAPGRLVYCQATLVKTQLLS